MPAKRTAAKITINIAVMLFSFSCLFPIVWMIYSSFKTEPEFARNIISLPATFHFDNYKEAVIKGKMGLFFINSLFNSLITIVLTIVIGYSTGYILSRFRFAGRNVIYVIFLAGLIVPIYALLIPIFIEFRGMNLYNRRFTLILPYIAFQLPMTIFLIESYIKGIPRELEEAAVIDGCSFFQSVFRIIFPVCKPILATVTILTFLGTWNEFPLALILLADQKFKTVPIGLTYFTRAYSVDYPQLFAALSIASIPVIIVYLIFNNQIIKGMISGSVKG